MTTTCIHLRERFGKRYKIGVDRESYVAQYGATAVREDPWLLLIPGGRGHVYPHGGDLLAASTNTSGPTAKAVLQLPGVIVHQNGADGVTVLFREPQLSQVAQLLQLRRRRRVSDQERQRLVELGRQHGFQARSAICESDSEARPCDRPPLVDQKHLSGQRVLFEV